MIIGIGTDVVKIERIRRLLERYPNFVEKVFTKEEIRYCQSRSNPAESYAVRFAAKEAVMKALGTGWVSHVNWSDIEVIRDDSGNPGILMHQGAAKLSAVLGIDHIHLSLSHEKEYALAFAVVEHQKA